MIARVAGLLLLLALLCRGQGTRFGAFDLWITGGVAAWQVEVEGEGRIVGVEGGEGEAWREPAYYDPAALAGGRIVLAAFTTRTEVPEGRVRVARLHMESPSGLTARMIASAAVGGERIEVTVALLPAGEGR